MPLTTERTLCLRETVCGADGDRSLGHGQQVTMPPDSHSELGSDGPAPCLPLLTRRWAHQVPELDGPSGSSLSHGNSFCRGPEQGRKPGGARGEGAPTPASGDRPSAYGVSNQSQTSIPYAARGPVRFQPSSMSFCTGLNSEGSSSKHSTGGTESPKAGGRLFPARTSPTQGGAARAGDALQQDVKLGKRGFPRKLSLT